MIGVDIGGTNLFVGIIENGKVIERKHELICSTNNFEGVASQVCTLISQLNVVDIQKVGIAVAGSVNVNTGVVIHAQNLRWENAPLAQFVSDQLHCDVIIENDVSAAALGEFHYGSGRDCESMFAVWIGTGIGGGLILNNEIWRGPLGTGGEFGMAISDPLPYSINRTLESLASRSGYQNLLGNNSLTTHDIVSLYEHDDTLTRVLQDGARRIGTAIANTITLLSIDTVILGGGLIEALGESYVEIIREQFDLDVFPKHCQQCVFKITELGSDAGLLGAASL